LAAATCGFFLAASTDEAERAKAAMAMNDTNLVIISSLKKQQQLPVTEISDTLRFKLGHRPCRISGDFAGVRACRSVR
jgi:hypothetical protein